MSTFQDNIKEPDVFKEAVKCLIPTPPKNERQPHSLTLLKKRRAALKVQEDVKQHIEELDSAQCAFHLHKIELKKKEEQMKQRMQNNNLLRLSKERQLSVERRSKCNRELIKQNQEHLQKLRVELNSLLVQQQQLTEEVEKKLIFGEIMDEVVKTHGGRFKDPKELIEHYHRRNEIHQDLMTALDERRETLAHLQHSSNLMKKKHSIRQVMNRTKLQTLKEKLDDAEAEVLKWEALWEEVQHSVRMTECQLAEIHQRACSLSKHLWRKESRFSKQTNMDTVELLDKIQDFVCDLKSILEEVNKAESHHNRKTKFDTTPQ